MFFFSDALALDILCRSDAFVPSTTANLANPPGVMTLAGSSALFFRPSDTGCA